MSESTQAGSAAARPAAEGGSLHAVACWAGCLGIYMTFGAALLVFQIGTMADSLRFWVGGAVFVALVGVGHLLLRRGLRRGNRLAVVVYGLYSLALMTPGLWLLMQGGPRRLDVVALGLIGWLMLATPWWRATSRTMSEGSAS